MGGIFDLKATHNPHRWYLPVTQDICVGAEDRRFLFGGVGMAAAISAMEQTTGRQVIWATAHYLSFARPGSIVDLDVWVPAAGRVTSQATVIAHIDDSQIITVKAALGGQDDAPVEQWVTMPEVPGPDDCPEVYSWRNQPKGLIPRFETRLAYGTYNDGTPVEGKGEGRVTFWIRSREGLPADSQFLAVAADYVSVGLTGALGYFAGGSSLDNTVRFGRIEPVEWVLCDVRIEMLHRGVAHGVMHLYSQQGTLMASASQSLIVRAFPGSRKRAE